MYSTLTTPELARTSEQAVLTPSLTALGSAYTCETSGKVATLVDTARVASLTRCPA